MANLIANHKRYFSRREIHSNVEWSWGRNSVIHENPVNSKDGIESQDHKKNVSSNSSENEINPRGRSESASSVKSTHVLSRTTKQKQIRFNKETSFSPLPWFMRADTETTESSDESGSEKEEKQESDITGPSSSAPTTPIPGMQKTPSFSSPEIQKTPSFSQIERVPGSEIFVFIMQGNVVGLRNHFKQYPGLNVNITNAKSQTPLFCATEKKSPELVELLLRQGADPNISEELGNPLQFFVFCCSFCSFIKGFTPLHNAALVGSIEVVLHLIRAGAHVNIQNKSGMTPLHLATKKEFYEIIRVLIKYGAEPTIKDNLGKQAIDYARNQTTSNFLKGRYWNKQ